MRQVQNIARDFIAIYTDENKYTAFVQYTTFDAPVDVMLDVFKNTEHGSSFCLDFQVNSISPETCCFY